MSAGGSLARLPGGVPPPLLSPSPLRQSLNDILAGTAGGIMTVLVGHPLDTIKVRLQASANSRMTMVGCIRETLRVEGVRGFYKGMQSPLAGEGFFNAAQFLAYGHAKRIVLEWETSRDVAAGRQPNNDLTILGYFFAGGLTGAVSTLVETPIDLFKSQLQTQIFRQTPLFTTLPGAIGYVMRHNGIAGCWQGVAATWLRTTPASACYFGVYEWTKSLQVQPGQTKEQLPPQALLIAGGMAGLAYWSSSFPLDSIKSAMQSDAVRRSERRYTSVVDCARQLYADGGVRRFYRGLAPCLLRSFPANAACFFAYEKALRFLEKL